MCIDEQLLSSYLDGELCEPYKSQTEEHLSYCKACKARLDRMAFLQGRLKTGLKEEERFNAHKEEVFQLLQQKYFSEEKKHVSFLRRKLEVSLPAMITSAAAVVVVFIGGFVLFGSNASQTSDIVPSFNVQAGSDNVRFVSHTEQGLDSYSLEEILKYLDQKGYEVDISIKGLRPLEELPTP